MIILAFIIVGAYLELHNKKIMNNVITNSSDPNNPNFFTDNNCNCLARERLLCNPGYKLDAVHRLCISSQNYTSVMLGCSKYDCSGTIYSLNLNNSMWSKQTGA